VVTELQMAQALYDHYNSVLGSSFECSRRVNLSAIGLPSLDFSDLEVLFTKDEIRAVVMNMPNDKALGPDGFTCLFYKVAWDIIKTDVLYVFNAFWAQDGRSFSHLNGAYMVLLKKKAQPAEIQDYLHISLIHSFSKLITWPTDWRRGSTRWFATTKVRSSKDVASMTTSEQSVYRARRCTLSAHDVCYSKSTSPRPSTPSHGRSLLRCSNIWALDAVGGIRSPSSSTRRALKFCSMGSQAGGFAMLEACSRRTCYPQCCSCSSWR
jgi:hypothetical protein